MKKYTYCIYYVDNLKNDIKYIEEFNNTEDLARAYNLKNKKSIYNYIINGLDNINLLNLKHKLKDNYIIIKDLLD